MMVSKDGLKVYIYAKSFDNVSGYGVVRSNTWECSSVVEWRSPKPMMQVRFLSFPPTDSQHILICNRLRRAIAWHKPIERSQYAKVARVGSIIPLIKPLVRFGRNEVT